jgi:hypothetical protein
MTVALIEGIPSPEIQRHVRSVGTDRPSSPVLAVAVVGVNKNLYAAIDNPDRVNRDWHRGRGTRRDSSREIETRAMQPAFDAAFHDLPLRQSDLSVAALIDEGIDLAVTANQADRLPGHLDAKDAVIVKVRLGNTDHPHWTTASNWLCAIVCCCLMSVFQSHPADSRTTLGLPQSLR